MCLSTAVSPSGNLGLERRSAHVFSLWRRKIWGRGGCETVWLGNFCSSVFRILLILRPSSLKRPRFSLRTASADTFGSVLEILLLILIFIFGPIDVKTATGQSKNISCLQSAAILIGKQSQRLLPLKLPSQSAYRLLTKHLIPGIS